MGGYLDTGMAVLQALGTYYQIQAQNQQAINEINAARRATEAVYQQLDLRQQQEAESAAVEMMERAIQGLTMRSKINNALGAAGVAGNSPIAEIGATYTDQSKDIGIIRQNIANITQQLQAEKFGAYSQQMSTINAARSRMISPALGLLMIGSSAWQGYAMGREWEKDNPKEPKKPKEPKGK